MGFPAIGDAVRTGKVSAGTFVEPFYSAEVAKGGLRKLFTAVEAVGYDHELLDIFFGEKFLKAHPARGARLPRRLRRGHEVLPRQHRAGEGATCTRPGFVRTPLEIYLKNADWKRDPGRRASTSRA